jgi:hypothetical protein
LREKDFVVSKTDQTGKLTDGNPIFIEFSGYIEAEHIGQDHNIRCHPDMPRSVFKYRKMLVAEQQVDRRQAITAGISVLTNYIDITKGITVNSFLIFNCKNSLSLLLLSLATVHFTVAVGLMLAPAIYFSCILLVFFRFRSQVKKENQILYIKIRGSYEL